jgi:hypothetical protein
MDFFCQARQKKQKRLVVPFYLGKIPVLFAPNTFAEI